MAKVEYLTFNRFLSLFNPKALYVLSYSWLFGMSLWVTFFGGVIAFKTLPRQQFGQLQLKTFPIYFSINVALSSLMMAYWVFTHPDVISYISRPTVADVAQLYALFVVFGTHGLNCFVVGPIASKVKVQRHKLEKDEGKGYDEKEVSAQMKAFNRKFGMLHGISSLLNLIAFIALVFHGLWIGNAGAKGY
ncbi:protein of unknown function (DUF4149) domain containing protein [Amanita muscaria]